jgi:thioredoxin-dependent peroxiredoxin
MTHSLALLTAEMKAFQADSAAFERLNTQALGVSPDDVATHQRFAESLNLTFPLVSDPGGRIRAQYGPGRIAFLIDTRGIVRLIVEGMPDNRKVLADIERLLE